MRTVTVVCDRCRTRVALPYESGVERHYPWRQHPLGNPSGWVEQLGDDAVQDICPCCVTPEERAERLVREIEIDLIFDEPELFYEQETDA